MAKVTIDAGHGGYDGGANYNGRLEKNDNLEIALAVGELLEQNGIEVGYTRITDVYDSPNEKARIANEQGSDLFVSIHRNSSPNPNTYSGVETLLYEESGLKQDVANAINEELAKVGFNNLGLNVRKDLTVLRRTQMPAVLVEVGFINTEADNQLLDNSFDETVRAIANGIFKTLTGNELPDANAPMPVTAVKETNISDDVEPMTGNMPSGMSVLQGARDNNQMPTSEQQDAGRAWMPKPPGRPGKEYRIQVGLYREYRNAVNIAYELEVMGFPVEMRTSGDLYAVQVGPFRKRSEAIGVENQLQRMGYDTLLLEFDPEMETEF